MVLITDGPNSTIIVAGNATLDAHLEGTVQLVQPNLVIVSSGDSSYHFKRAFKVEDGPITPGYKHRVELDINDYPRGLEDFMRGLKYQLRPGGGNINTATSISNRADLKSDLSLVLLDVSAGESLLTEHLDRLGIQHKFLGYRPPPVNVVIGGRDDKIILKGPMLERVDISDRDKSTIDQMVENSQGVIINSAKDESFVEALMSSAQSRGIPVYIMVTSSLNKSLVMNKILPAGVITINHEDTAKLYGENPLDYTSHQLFEIAVEHMKQLKETNKGHGLFITLGPNGVLYSDRNTTMRHTRLKEEFTEIVFHSVSSRFGSTNGAGDTFQGELAVQYLGNKTPDIDEVVQRASKAAIRHIGYRGGLRHSDFITRTL